jgi:hypothetical protein
MSAARIRGADELLGDVIGELDEVFAGLGELGAAFADLGGEPIRRTDVAALRPVILALLDAHPDLVTGAGIVTAPGLLEDAPRWLEWWWRADRATPEPLRVNLDPAAPDFYDYTTTAWFTATEPCMAGPYVDYACTNDYAITLSVPVPGRGVAAADVLVAALERRVLPVLLAHGAPLALTSADGRVIVSNDASLAPGLRVDVGDAGATGWLLVEPSVS